MDEEYSISCKPCKNYTKGYIDNIFAADKVHRINREIVQQVAPEYVPDVGSRVDIAADIDQY